MSLHIQYAQFAHLFLLLLLCMFCGGSSAISIDNDIIGDPDIECLDQEIRVWVKTRKIFAGRIYAKGKSEDPDCSKDNFAKDRTKKPHFDLPLGMCGMKSQRSLDPRGMYYGITLVISFHPLFITKVDQAFHVKCFFEEANRGLTAELGVSMIPTTEVNARHSIMGCSYSIHRSSILDLDAGRPAGTAIQFAKVGDKVLHQWHCEDPMFGILINNCYVTDGVNKRAQVIDASGCPVDPILITGIRYSADLQRAYAESQVFKFADRPGVWFFCQIQMCMKKERMCDGITPPSCATTTRPPTDERSPSGRRSGSRERGDGSERVDGIDNGVEEPLGGSRGDDLDSNGDSSNPVRISTDKVPNDYENYIGETGGGTSGSTGRGSGGSQRTRRPLRPPPRQQEQTKAPDGYAPAQSPSAVEYEANEDDSAKSVTVFEPGYSPTDSGSFPADKGRGFSASQGQDAGGEAGASYDSTGVHRSKVITEENVSAPDPYQAPPLGRDEAALGSSKKTQEELKRSKSLQASVDFEAADDLRPNGSVNGAPAPPVGSVGPRTTIAGPPSSIAATTKPTASKKDYIEYDGSDDENRAAVDNDDEDVTIPPNLVDLLAKLPPDEEINADNLQRMFRDSVADRRALLSGFDALINKMRRNEAHGEEKSSIRKSPLRHQSTPMSPFIISAPSFNAGGAKNLPIGPMRRLPTARLVPGTKIGIQHVSWDSAPEQQQNRLARDSPLPPVRAHSANAERKSNEHAAEYNNILHTTTPTTTSEHNDSNYDNETHSATSKVARSVSSVDSGPGGLLSSTLPLPRKAGWVKAGGTPPSSSTSSASHHLLIPSGGDLVMGGGPNDPPMIAGQLLIYDLDETPPDEESRLSVGLANGGESAVRVGGGECALTRQGLFLLASSLSSLIAALVIVVVALLFKTRNAKNTQISDYRHERSEYPSSTTLAALSLSSSSLKSGERKMGGEWLQDRSDRPSTTNAPTTFETFSMEPPPRSSLSSSNLAHNAKPYFAKLQ